MADTKRLPVHLGELSEAIDDASPEHQWYLDLETGELVLLSDYMDEAAEIAERIEAEGERYETVPPREAAEAYRDMEDFIAQVRSRRLAELLDVAIAGKGAFRRFKDVLAGFPEERERWFRFRDAKLRECSLEWLSDMGVEIE